MSILGVNVMPGHRKSRAYKERPNARKHNNNSTVVASAPTDPFTLESLPTCEVLTGDAHVTLQRLPDRCVDLVILDPPYWKVIGEQWDYRWRTEEDYRQWCCTWFTEIKRVCK